MTDQPRHTPIDSAAGPDSGSSSDDMAVLRSIWQRGAAAADLDDACSPTKVCRNMKDVTFEGYAEDGGDIRAAWRNTLARDGKLSGSSVADLIANPGA